MAGDRVEGWDAHLRSLVSLRPDNPVTGTGVLAEGRRHGIASRFGTGRADVHPLLLDPVVGARPWVAAAAGAAGVVRAAVRTARR